jgi:LysR family transcriptional regulator, hca operon transcriptional activator
MAMSLVTSERGVAPLHISIEDYLPPSIMSRRLRGEQPTVDLMIGYREDNASPILKTSCPESTDCWVRATIGRRMTWVPATSRHVLVTRLN